MQNEYKNETGKDLAKIIIVIGPTASGKSDLAVKIAKEIQETGYATIEKLDSGNKIYKKVFFDKKECVIISADSRQIYKYLDIGSGKITKEEMQNIQHFGLDIVEPKYNLIKDIANKSTLEMKNENELNAEKKDEEKNKIEMYENFTAADWLRYATDKIGNIINENKIPIICGGTGLYIDALLYGLDNNPEPDYIFRKTLENKTTEEIKDMIKEKLAEQDDLDYFYNLNNSEQNNRNRLIRKLELLNSGHKIKNNLEINATRSGDSDDELNTNLNSGKRILKYNPEFIILEPELDILQEKIKLRLEKRLGLNEKENNINNNAASYACGKESEKNRINSSPLISEIQDMLEDKKVDPKWLMSLGLEYKYVTAYVLGQIGFEEMINILNIKIFQYAKRQIKWNRRYGGLANKSDSNP